MATGLCVRDVMTAEVVTVGQNEKLAVAERRMQAGNMRHMVVTDGDGALAGVVSQRDLFHGGLLRALGYGTHAKEQALDSLVVKEAMRTALVVTSPEVPLEQAAAEMWEKKVGCLPVVDSGSIVGIITEGDFVALAAGKKPTAK